MSIITAYFCALPISAISSHDSTLQEPVELISKLLELAEYSISLSTKSVTVGANAAVLVLALTFALSPVKTTFLAVALAGDPRTWLPTLR